MGKVYEWCPSCGNKTLHLVNGWPNWGDGTRSCRKCHLRLGPEVVIAQHHRTYWEHNGERARLESAWSWECSCGAAESHSTKAGAEGEWIHHVKVKVKV